MEGAEGIGEVVTGGLMARALESRTGEGGDGHGGACLNCGVQLAGEFCNRCGQAAHVHRTLGAFWHDIAHSVLHFDGKIWRTLPLLAWHPGELTRRYVEGERAKFVSPMALFLFSAFLMFAVVSTLGGPFGIRGDAEERVQEEREYRRERAEALAELRTLEADRERLEAGGRSTAAIDAGIKLHQRAISELDSNRRNEAARERTEAESGKREIASGTTSGGKDVKLTVWRTGIPAIDDAVARAEGNPDLLIYKLQNNAYKFSWALIPISVPFVWTLFLHRARYRKYKAYDHIVFVTYSIAFMSIGFIILTLLRPLGAGETVAGLAITFGPPIHMYRQLRGAYRLSRFSALWRTFLLLIFAALASSLFLSLLLALGVLG